MWRPIVIFLAFLGLMVGILILSGEWLSDWAAKQWHLTLAVLASLTAFFAGLIIHDYIDNQGRFKLVKLAKRPSLHFKSNMTWADMLARSRAMATLNGVVLLALALTARVLLVGKLEGGILLFSILAVAVVCFDLFLLSWRINRGAFGENRAEAQELLRFVSRHHTGDGPRPRRAVRDPMKKAAIRPNANAVGGD